MASHYYGINTGGNMEADVAIGTATSSRHVELVLLDGAALDRQKVLNALEVITRVIEDPDTKITA